MSEYRVISESRGFYYLALNHDVKCSTLCGRYQYELDNNPTLPRPVVGDYVCLDDSGRINAIVNRKNSLSRKRVGKKMEAQVMAANLDFLIITMPLDKEFDANKKDYISQISNIDRIPIMCTSTNDRESIDKLKKIMCTGTTSAFIGPSGAGKSTIINILLNKTVQKTQAVRDSDNKGRHTTTARQLVYLENEAAIIDTPGIREISFWLDKLDFEVEKTIYDLVGKCKFSNCTHISEPGCKIIEALRNNLISQTQYRQLLKYKSELLFLKANQEHDITSIKKRNKKIKNRKNNQNNKSST